MPSPAVATFQKTYKARNWYEVSQGDYLPAEHRGVCGMMVGHWIQRKLIHNKYSLKTSNKDGKFWMGCLPARRWESTRMRRKVDKYQDPKWRKEHFRPGTFKENDIDTWNICRGSIEPETTGTDFFDNVLQKSQSAVLSNFDLYDSFCFLISYKEVKGEIGGHAQAFELDKKSIHFFDPNIGEYIYSLPGDQRELLDHFAVDLWSLIEEFGFTYFEVDCFARGRPLEKDDEDSPFGLF